MPDRSSQVLASLIFATAVAHAGPLPMCGTQFQYSCAAFTLGGYTVIQPLASTGQTEITGYNASSSAVFDQTIPIPPTGPVGFDVQQAVLRADALLVLQSGQASTLPACSSSIVNLCIAPNPGGPVVVTNSTTSSYVAVDTPVSQRIDQYSTTLIATLNGNPVFSQTYSAQFGAPTVQAAVLAADAILTGDAASFGAPFLASGSTSLQGSQLSYAQTGEGGTGNTLIITTQTFGPAAILVGENQTDVFFILAGQLDLNVNTNIEFAIDRNVITTNTYLTTQTYDIQGTTTSATPEPATWTLLALGLAGIALGGLVRSGNSIHGLH